MKKFTMMMLVALFVATATVAQAGPKRVVKLPQKPGQTQLAASQNQQRPNLQQQRGRLTADMGRMMRANAASSARTGRLSMPWQKAAKAPARVGAPITDQPEGRYQLYERNGDSFFNTIFGVYENPAVGKLAEVVFADGGKVYMKYVISQVSCPGWLEGTLSGSKISFTLPQNIYPMGDDENYYAMAMTFDAAEQTYVGIKDETTVTMDYDAATGEISLTSGDYATGDMIIGLAEEDGFWTGYGDWNFTMTVVNDEPLSALAGLETEEYVIQADGFEGTIANVGFQGSDIYVQGLYPTMPEAWVKGTIAGDKATFKSGQYLGPDFDNISLQYLISATAETTHVEDPEWGDYDETYYFVSDADIVFNYDAATKTLSEGSMFMVNAGTTEVSYAICYENCQMKPFVEVAATPMAPTSVDYTEMGYDYYTYGYGWSYLDVTIVPNDVDGNYIKPDKLSYVIWTRVNGEEKPLTLSAYDYQNLDEDMTEVPYDFTEDWDFYVQGTQREFYLYVIGFEAIGVQTIYRGGGEEHRSEITWTDVWGMGSEIQPEAATPDYPEVDPSDVGGSITYGAYTGNESRVTFGDWKPQTYDVAMKVEDAAIVGTYIESVTFNLRTIAGLSSLKVWLSSQLRVEDGQNVPDLVSVPVDMPTRTGDVTVTLPKPYIIPEEGVYVGYSFDLSESANSARNMPITIVSEVKPSGLFVHSTGGIMKWLDFSEIVGGSACINVTLGGSQVKENAVAPVDGQTVYVKAGEQATATIDFVNHGSEGIKSLDVEYDFNGLTQRQHITPESPVKGFFGLTYTYTLTLPIVNNAGTYELGVKVVKVNGVDNEEEAAPASTDIVVVNTMPKHRALLEEYTGTWCGWCTRGFVALELLKELYPDDYVCVSYHNGDPMEITSYYPSEVGGFPSAWVDRGIEVDPFNGLEEEGFHVTDVLDWRNSMFGMADISAKASLNAEANTVDVEAEATFPFDADDAQFALEYILVEDGLTGEGSDWTQQNYYAGMDAEEELAEFTGGESSVKGLVFNDVVVMQSEPGGIFESLPAELQADVPVSHAYSFELDNAMNTSFEPIIQDVNQLSVVALVVNTATGEVCNAIRVPVTKDGDATAIQTVGGQGRTVSSVQFFDLSGRQLSSRAKGAGIVRINYADGTSRTMKVMK